MSSLVYIIWIYLCHNVFVLFVTKCKQIQFFERNEILLEKSQNAFLLLHRSSN